MGQAESFVTVETDQGLSLIEDLITGGNTDGELIWLYRLV